MQQAVIERLKKQIEGFEHSASPEQVGTVISVGDGVCEIEGLPKALMSEMLVFDTSKGKTLEKAIDTHTDVIGLVMNLEVETVKAAILGNASMITEGMQVRATGKVLSLPVGDSLVGRVVDALGTPVDGQGPLLNTELYQIERPSYGVMDRESVKTPLHTGIKAIDAMIPIGRGQRELIIGDRYTGKTVIAIDTILNQKNEPKETRPICIYTSIGQKESKTARIVQVLKDAGAMEYTIVVDAPASASATLQFLAPYAAASIGEYFMEKGRDVLVIYDDLSKHAVAYRQVSLLLRRPPGREAYPGDIFYLHSRLLERSAKLSKEKGGGSLTALPIIETQEGDVSAYIPTNVISITDGQIYLETDIFNKGIRPAINVGLSVSRVGSSAQTKAMKKVAGKTRIELAQFRELEAFSQFASDLDADTKKRLDKGERLVELLKQPRQKPIPFYEQVILLFAAAEGVFDSVAVNEVSKTADALITLVKSQHEKVINDVRDSKDLSDESLATLRQVFTDVKDAQSK